MNETDQRETKVGVGESSGSLWKNSRTPRHIVEMHNIARKAPFLVAEEGASWYFQPVQISLIHLKWGKDFFLVEVEVGQLAGVEEVEEEEQGDSGIQITQTKNLLLPAIGPHSIHLFSSLYIFRQVQDMDSFIFWTQMMR